MYNKLNRTASIKSYKYKDIFALHDHNSTNEYFSVFVCTCVYVYTYLSVSLYIYVRVKLRGRE